MAGAMAGEPGAPISASRNRLGRDHPGLAVQPDPMERANDVVEVTRGHLAPIVSLHAQPGQQRHQRGVAQPRGLIDGAGPAGFAIEVDAQP